MIENKRLVNYFKHYVSEVLGPIGKSDVKYKGYFTRIFPVPPSNFGAAFEPVNAESMTFNLQDRRLEIETCFASLTHQYRIRTRYVDGPKVFVSEFLIPGEAYSRQALEYNFREVHREFKAEGLIQLTPEEEAEESYKLAKKQAMAAMYGANAGEFDMGLLKKELNNVKTPNWLVKGPDGTMHVSNPDAGTQVLNNIFTQMNAAKATEIHMGMSAFNQIKKLAEEHFQKTGEFPNPDKFIGLGMKVAIDPGVPDGYVVVHATQPPIQLMPKSKHVKKTVEDYGNSGSALAALVPALNHRGIPCPEPANCAGIAHNAPLSDMIIHLNDSHRWPRSATDPNPYNKPNIADWIDEVCLIHGLDQSFHPKEEKKPTVRDSAAKKEKGKIEGASLSHSYVDEPVVIDDEWLDTYYENKKFKKQQAILAEQVEAYKEKLIKGFQKYKFPKLEG